MNLRNAREYIEKLLWIRTKEGDETRLVLKPAQRKLYEAVKQQVEAGKPVRIIVLKARQMGFSTLISGLIFHACATQEWQTRPPTSTRCTCDFSTAFRPGSGPCGRRPT